MSIKLDASERADFERDGFLVIRSLLAEDDLARLDGAIKNNMPHNAYARGKTYPQVAKYTLSEQCPSDPGLAYIVEHPKIVSPVEQLLGGPAHLTAYVVYLRTPNDNGSLMHNDYKRWRPVGSSMNWLFTIAPLTDFDADTGPLLVAPGSHQLHLVEDRGEKTLHRGAPEQPLEADFIDPGLRRGDLLLMNMYTWHWAPPNVSDHDRIGVFNKYTAGNAPPAAGYFVNSNAVRDALSPAGRRLVGVASDRGIATTRLLLSREQGGVNEVVLVRPAHAGASWGLPGGAGFEEDVIPGWDVGNRIGALNAHNREQLGLELPWVSYVGDFDDPAGLCRVYGYTAPGLPEIGAPDSFEHQWVAASKLVGRGDFEPDYLAQAVDTWLDPGIVRGKGLSQVQAQANQYAV